MIPSRKPVPAFLDAGNVPRCTRIEFILLDGEGTYWWQMWSHDRLLESFEGGPDELQKYIKSTVVCLLPVAYDPAVTSLLGRS